jgi:hypothetical protein
VPLKELARIENDISFRLERDYRTAGKFNSPTRPNLLELTFCFVRIDAIGQMSCQPKNERLVGCMALTGPGERPENSDRNPARPLQ